MEGGKAYLLPNGVCVSLEQLGEAVQRAEAALTVEELFSGVLVGWPGGKGLKFFTKCVRERMCVAGVRVCNEICEGCL